MQLKIHRGTHEIGGTCVEVSTQKTRLLIDFGLPLVSPSDKTKPLDTNALKGLPTEALIKLGVLPDIKGLYTKTGAPPFQGILLSHPHRDHFGLLSHVRDDIPVYMAPHTKWLIQASNIFTPDKTNIRNWAPISDETPFYVGDIKVVSYAMDHSAFDSRSFLLSAGGRTVFYTGDFRAHGRKWQLFHRLPAKLPHKIDVLLMEGTHVGNPRGPLRTETDIKNKIQATGLKYSGLKLVYTSGQNIDRLVSFYKAAKHSGKALVLDLYTAFILDSLKYPGIPHPSRRFPEIKVLYSKPYMKRLALAGLKDAWDKYRPYQVWPRQIARNPGDYFLMYRPGVIKEIEEIGNFKDSVLIYSLYSGYRTEKSYAKVLAFLQKYGISETIIHTSGHAYPKHLWLLANKLKPGVLIPVHTFDPEGFKSIYPDVKVLQDGESFNIPLNA